MSLVPLSKETFLTVCMQESSPDPKCRETAVLEGGIEARIQYVTSNIDTLHLHKMMIIIYMYIVRGSS